MRSVLKDCWLKVTFEELVRPHGLKELVRTGRIGLGRASATNRNHRKQHVLR